MGLPPDPWDGDDQEEVFYVNDDDTYESGKVYEDSAGRKFRITIEPIEEATHA